MFDTIDQWNFLFFIFLSNKETAFSNESIGNQS